MASSESGLSIPSSTVSPASVSASSTSASNAAESTSPSLPGISRSSSLLFGVLITFLALFVAFMACGYSNRRGIVRMRALQVRELENARRARGATVAAVRPTLCDVWIERPGPSLSESGAGKLKEKEKEGELEGGSEWKEITPLAATVRRAKRSSAPAAGVGPSASPASVARPSPTTPSHFLPATLRNALPTFRTRSAAGASAAATTTRPPPSPRPPALLPITYIPPPPQVAPGVYPRPHPRPRPLSDSIISPGATPSSPPPPGAPPRIQHLAGPASAYDPSVPALANLQGGAAWVYANLGRRMNSAAANAYAMMMSEADERARTPPPVEGVQVAVLIAMPSPNLHERGGEIEEVRNDDDGGIQASGAVLELGFADLKPIPGLEELDRG